MLKEKLLQDLKTAMKEKDELMAMKVSQLGLNPEDEEDKQTRSIGDGIFEDHMPIDGLPEIFRITAVEVRDYLYSSEGGKDFTIDSLPNEAKRIVCVVNLNHIKNTHILQYIRTIFHMNYSVFSTK